MIFAWCVADTNCHRITDAITATAAEKLAFPTTCGNTKPERALAAAKPRSNLLSNLPILPFNSLKPDWKFYY